MTTVRILVVEDDLAIARMLKDSLNLAGYDVTTVTNAEEALASTWELHPVLIVIDWHLKDSLPGSEVVRRLRDAGSTIPIIMVTATHYDVVDALAIGSDDFIKKPFLPTELIARIKARLRDSLQQGNAYNKSMYIPLQFLDIKMDELTHKVWRGQNEISLTLQEYKLLECFLRNPRRVLKYDFIITQIWEHAWGGSQKSLEVYIGYLRKKLDANKRPRLIQTVRGFGYILKESEESK